MHKDLRAAGTYLWAFVYWIVIAVLIGVMCGAAGGVFALAVEWATEMRMKHGFLLYLLPLGGLAIAGLYKLMRIPLSMGTDAIIFTVRSQGKVPLLMAPAISLSTLLTHLLGGSSGREGAALQLGGTLGAAVGRLTNPKSDSRRICELCGMAALFSALFGTPLTATFFVMEVIDVGRVNTRALFPCMTASIVAGLIAQALGVHKEPFFLAAGLEAITGISLLQAGGIGLCCAVTSIFFCRMMHLTGHGLRKLLPNDYLRIALGGAAVILLTLLLGTRDYLGAGMPVIFSALAGQARPEAFLLKIIFTTVTLCSGFKGGEIVPSLFIGSTLGCAVSALLGINPCVGAGLGMVGVFCGVTNAPLASIMLSVELFGTEYLPLFGAAAAVSYMLSGHISLYHAQQFDAPKMGYTHK